MYAIRSYYGNTYISIDENMPKVHGTRPTVDITAEYVVKSYGRNAVGVILTGIGKDGASVITSYSIHYTKLYDT